VDKLGLAKSTFTFVNVVGMEEVPYEASSEAACDAIANQQPVPGQDSMISKSFDVGFDVVPANSGGVSDLLPELTQGIQENLASELACCGNTRTGSGRMLRELDNGRNLRCGQCDFHHRKGGATGIMSARYGWTVYSHCDKSSSVPQGR